MAFGRRAVLATKIIGALILTVGYAFFLFAAIRHFGVSQVQAPPTGGWISSSLVYVSYNAVALPSCLYAFEGLKNRYELVLSAIVAMLLVAVPMALVAAAVFIAHPSVLESPVPLYDVLLATKAQSLLAVYYLILIWTLFDTAVGLIFAIVQRAEAHVRERGRQIGKIQRGALTLALLVTAVVLSKAGIIALVARGYSGMAYAFLAVMVVPMLVAWLRRLVDPPNQG